MKTMREEEEGVDVQAVRLAAAKEERAAADALDALVRLVDAMRERAPAVLR